MISYISAYMPTIIGAAIVFGVFILIVVKQIIRRKYRKPGCGCGCDGCPNSSFCHKP